MAMLQEIGGLLGDVVKALGVEPAAEPAQESECSFGCTVCFFKGGVVTRDGDAVYRVTGFHGFQNYICVTLCFFV